jgi:hypothetical protein
MNITTKYLCHVVGEEATRVERWHLSTVKRMKAYAIAIHIPVILWAITGYVLASQIFELNFWPSISASLFCAGLIYMVERLVLATPKGGFVNLGRFTIGIVMAVIGACTVDLVLFDKEISHQLREIDEIRITEKYEKLLDSQGQIVADKKSDWFKAQDASNCEANGTCGSKVRSVGPVYRELSRQAKILREEYFSAQRRLEEISKEKSLESLESSTIAVKEAGLLARVEALHQYVANNTAAFIAWILFLLLILFFELIVVMVKIVFQGKETVDDQIDRYRELVSQHKARAYMDATTSPVARAQRLLDDVYNSNGI